MKNQETQTVELGDIRAKNLGLEIAGVAYAYWETRGRIDGHDVEDWLAAEQEVQRRHNLETPDSEHRAAIGRAA